MLLQLHKLMRALRQCSLGTIRLVLTELGVITGMRASAFALAVIVEVDA
jgi:hypothetical protein